MKKEVGELRRRLRPEKNRYYHHPGGAMSTRWGESVAQFDQSLALMTQEETETLLACCAAPVGNVWERTCWTSPSRPGRWWRGRSAAGSCACGDTALKDGGGGGGILPLVRQSLTLEATT